MSINKENIKHSLWDSNKALSKEWHPSLNGELTPKDVTFMSGQKIWWLCGNGHYWDAIVASRNRECGSGCPYCSNQKVWIGFNDIWTTNPELASILANPEDGHEYVEGSGQKVDWKCPCCKYTIKNKSIVQIRNKGLNCPKCSDGIKFPEKSLLIILSKLGINFIHNGRFKWSGVKRYDFYIPSLNLIIETHGGQHYNDIGFNTVGGRSLQEEQENDRYKYELAIDNGIKPENYIIIDCRKSNFDFIKNNILRSELNGVLDLDDVDWEEIYIHSQSSLKLEALRIFLEETTSIPLIAKRLNLHNTTISKYLKDMSIVGLCNYKDSKHFIYQVDLKGNIVAEWSGRDVLMKEYPEKISRKSLEYAYKNLTTYLGYYWLSSSPREVNKIIQDIKGVVVNE